MGIEKVLLILMLQTGDQFTDKVKEFSVQPSINCKRLVCAKYISKQGFEHSHVIGAPKLVIRFG